jgi:hypothetical protein
MKYWKAIALVRKVHSNCIQSQTGVMHADGHRRTIVEHILHILFLPGLHSDDTIRPYVNLPIRDSLPQYPQPPAVEQSDPPHFTEPTIAICGVGVPSPLHFQLHILTRLMLNEQGRITHHRDFWDVKDLVGLVPGATLVQWITTRLAGYSLALGTRMGSWIFGRRLLEAAVSEKDVETGRRTRSNSELTQAAAYARHVRAHTHGSFSSGRG